MPSEPEQSVLRRMVAPPRPSPVPHRGGGEGAHVRVQFPRVADQLLGLTVEVTSVSQKRVTQEALVASVRETDLIFTLAGPDGTLGLALVDGALLAALIEVQTTGRISTRPAAERVPSRTDGVVASDIVDSWLSHIVPPEAEETGGHAFHGAHRENRQLDLRAVALTLDPGAYHVLKITMSLGDGARTGVLTFALPAIPGAGALAARPVPAREAIAPVTTNMAVDMARFPVPLSGVLGLTEGALLPIPVERLGLATLRGIDGVDVARMSLGQVSGRWAIRKPRGAGADPPQSGFESLVATGAELEPSALEDQGGAQDTGAALESLPDLESVVGDLSVSHMTDPDAGGALADLPDLSDLPAPADLPDLSDLPELPELPDLPDLPS